jgi:predicted permease
MKRVAPPRAAVVILRWAVGQSATAEGILGDLTEDFHERRQQLGWGAAARWFWMQSLWIALVFRLTPGGARDRTRTRRIAAMDWLGELAQALRSLRRAPGFTTLAIGVLALGIGAATTMVTAFDAVLLRTLPVADPDRVVTLSLQRGHIDVLPLTPDEVVALARESRTLQEVAGVSSFGTASLPLTAGERALVLDVAMVTADFFDLLGARPALGRLLRPEDAEEGVAPGTVISYRTWQTEFGGDPRVLGCRLTTTQDGRSYAIIGVAPPGLDYPVGADYWTLYYPLRNVNVVARLARGVTPGAARAEFLSIARTFERVRSERDPVIAVVQSLEHAMLGDVRSILVASAAAVALLLLIACVNVGNLLLMRAARRSREVVVRRALGGSYGGVARLFLMESVLLGTAGGAVGFGLAVALLHLLPGLAPLSFPRTEMIALVGSPVAAAMGVSLLAVSVFGVLPALAAARGNLASALRIDGRSGTGTRRRRRVQRSLVVSQVALALILLVGAGLLTRSLQRLTQLELGYDLEGLSIVEVGVPFSDYRGSEMGAMFEEVFERLRAVPGVTTLTPIMSRPFIGRMAILQASPLLDGQSEGDSDVHPPAPLEVGGPELFRTLGIPILAGRGFEEADREDAPRVAVVSGAVAVRLWQGKSPIGKRLRLISDTPGWTTRGDDWWTVVGIAADTRFRGHRDPTPTIYLPWRQLQVLPAVVTVAVRTDGELAPVLPGMREAVRAFDPDFYVWRADTMADYLTGGPLAQPRMSALVLSGFGLAALLLAALGLYGVMSLAVRERTHDLGVRKALGATGARLRRAVLRDALAMSAMGGAAGLVGALLLSRLMSSLLFEVSPADPLTLAGACTLLLVVSVVAAYVPAWRATLIDPREALRAD